MIGLLLAVSLAGLAQGLTGFGFGIVAMAGLTPLLGPVGANLVVTPLAGINIALTLWAVRHAIQWRRALPLWIGAFVGTPVGVYILHHTEPELLNRVIGATILLTAVGSLRPAPKGGRPIPQRWGLAAGIFGGVMAGAVAMGGPPAVVYAYRQPWPVAAIKATLLLYFAWTVICRMGFFVASHSYTPEVMRSTLMLMPAAALATWAGVKLADRVPRPHVQRVVAILLIAAGLHLLF